MQPRWCTTRKLPLFLRAYEMLNQCLEEIIQVSCIIRYSYAHKKWIGVQPSKQRHNESYCLSWQVEHDSSKHQETFSKERWSIDQGHLQCFRHWLLSMKLPIVQWFRVVSYIIWKWSHWLVVGISVVLLRTLQKMLVIWKYLGDDVFGHLQFDWWELVTLRFCYVSRYLDS